MLRWNWKNKMGELVIEMLTAEGKKTYTRNIYAANCLFAVISEWYDSGNAQDMYAVHYFINDTDHLKRCLGLKKNHEGKKEDMYKDEFVSMRLNTFFKESVTIAKLFARAGHEVTLYYEEIIYEEQKD